MNRIIVILILGLVLLGRSKPGSLPAAAGQEAPSNVLVISLRPALTTRETLVQVGNVASLSGGTYALRKKVADLDLVELVPGGPSLVIGKEQVSIRLQIAGIDRDLFRMEGKKVVVTPASQELTEDSLVEAASQLVR